MIGIVDIFNRPDVVVAVLLGKVAELDEEDIAKFISLDAPICRGSSEPSEDYQAFVDYYSRPVAYRDAFLVRSSLLHYKHLGYVPFSSPPPETAVENKPTPAIPRPKLQPVIHPPGHVVTYVPCPNSPGAFTFYTEKMAELDREKSVRRFLSGADALLGTGLTNIYKSTPFSVAVEEDALFDPSIFCPPS